MNKKVILFDIDRTLLDTEKMIVSFDNIILSILGNPDYVEYKKTEADYFKTLPNERKFNVPDYAKFMSSKFKIGKDKEIVDLFYSDTHNHIYSDCLFDESKKVLDNFVNKYKLGIYSEGTAMFQNHKFNSLGLNKYFEKELIFIVDAKDTKEVIDRLPIDVVIVDDKESICNFLFENSIDCIWLNRKDERISDKYRTIHTLLELLDIL